MDKNSIPQNQLAQDRERQICSFFGVPHTLFETGNLDAFFASKVDPQDYPIKRIQFKWAGVPGYYSRQTMWADVIGREVRKGIVWLYVQPDCLNLPRWLKGSDILSFEMPFNVPVSDIYDEMGRWFKGQEYQSTKPGGFHYIPRPGTDLYTRSW